jgi:GNAT superfamily N-acetyltransferase
MKLTEELLPLAKDFDCGDGDLNEFLKSDSLNYYNGKIAVTYLLLCDNLPVGFFCLSNDAVELKGKEKNELRKLGKAQKTYPALKIGRLGIDKSRWNKGYGTFIIKHTIGFGIVHSKKAGCRYLTVDAYNKDLPIKFYSNNGFKKLLTDEEKPSLPMYLDLIKYANPLH